MVTELINLMTAYRANCSFTKLGSLVKLYRSVTPAEGNSLKAEVATFLNIASPGHGLLP